MTPTQRAQAFRLLVTRLERLLRKKGQQYGTSEDVHANYRAIERAGITTTRLAILARAVEKLQRVIDEERAETVSPAARLVEAEDLMGVLWNYWAEVWEQSDVSRS